MECATVSCDVEEFCTLLGRNYRTARKEHRCSECRRTILKGEKYLDERTLYGGEVRTWKTCADCESIRDNFFTEGWYCGECKYRLEEHISVARGDISESCLVALTPKAREMVCTMIEEVWEDDDDPND